MPGAGGGFMKAFPKMLIKLNTHPYPCSVWFTNSERLHRQQVLKFRDNPPPVCDYGVTSRDYSGMNICIGVFDNNHCTLSHELCHAVIDIFDAVGMAVNMETTEAFAYLYESLFSQSCEFMRNCMLGGEL